MQPDLTALIGSQNNEDEVPPLRFTVRLADGLRREHGAIPGLHLVELMRAHELPVKAECGGAGACATCHVRIPVRWQNALPPPSDDELAKLDEIPGADDSSRLACQIVMTDSLDGLEIALQCDSQLPQPAAKTAA